MKRGRFNQLPFEDRFRRSFDAKEGDECWLWSGYIGSRGYGYIKRNYQTLLAHRVSYELAHGPIEGDACVCHRCDTPACVNPAHLFLGSHADNAADRNSKGREAHPSGSKHPMAKLTEADVLAILASPESGRTLAKRYGVNPGQISNIRNGKSWVHVQSNYRAMGKVA